MEINILAVAKNSPIYILTRNSFYFHFVFSVCTQSIACLFLLIANGVIHLLQLCKNVFHVKTFFNTEIICDSLSKNICTYVDDIQDVCRLVVLALKLEHDFELFEWKMGSKLHWICASNNPVLLIVRRMEHFIRSLPRYAFALEGMRLIPY